MACSARSDITVVSTAIEHGNTRNPKISQDQVHLAEVLRILDNCSKAMLKEVRRRPGAVHVYVTCYHRTNAMNAPISVLLGPTMYPEHALFLAPDSAVGPVAVAIVKEKLEGRIQYRAVMRTRNCLLSLGLFIWAGQ